MIKTIRVRKQCDKNEELKYQPRTGLFSGSETRDDQRRRAFLKIWRTVLSGERCHASPSSLHWLASPTACAHQGPSDFLTPHLSFHFSLAVMAVMAEGAALLLHVGGDTILARERERESWLFLIFLPLPVSQDLDLRKMHNHAGLVS